MLGRSTSDYANESVLNLCATSQIYQIDCYPGARAGTLRRRRTKARASWLRGVDQEEGRRFVGGSDGDLLSVDVIFNAGAPELRVLIGFNHTCWLVNMQLQLGTRPAFRTAAG